MPLVDLLKTELPRAHCLTRHDVRVPSSVTSGNCFELNDAGVCAIGIGDLLCEHPSSVVSVLQYENYIDQFGQGVCLGQGARCDFVLWDRGQSCFSLVELTRCQVDSLQRKVAPSGSETKEDRARTKFFRTIDVLRLSARITL